MAGSQVIRISVVTVTSMLRRASTLVVFSSKSSKHFNSLSVVTNIFAGEAFAKKPASPWSALC